VSDGSTIKEWMEGSPSLGDLLVIPPTEIGFPVQVLTILGFPSVGKSTLLSLLTGTHSEAADYEFTTVCIASCREFDITSY